MKLKTLFKLFLLCLLIPTDVFASRDFSVDCTGRPRWDRFIVDEKDTNWDPASADCFGLPPQKKSASKSAPIQKSNPKEYGVYQESGAAALYGAPKMYGEPEQGTTPTKASTGLYGTYQPGPNPYGLYGKYNASEHIVKPKPAPMRVAAPTQKISNPKHPIAHKPVAQKPVVKVMPVVQKPVAPKPMIVAPEITPKPVPTPVAVVQQVSPPNPVLPDSKANSIATTLNNAFDIDSFCTEINPPVKGPMPKGLVLMPGRPDQMSCVTK